MATDAEVEESEMLPCGRTGKDVEVDVVIRSRAPYPVTI